MSLPLFLLLASKNVRWRPKQYLNQKVQHLALSVDHHHLSLFSALSPAAYCCLNHSTQLSLNSINDFRSHAPTQFPEND